MALGTHQQLTCTVLVWGGTALWVAESRRSVPRLTEQHPGTGIRMEHMPPRTARKNHVTQFTRRDFLLWGPKQQTSLVAILLLFLLFLTITWNTKSFFRDFRAANISIKFVTFISALWRNRGNRPSCFPWNLVLMIHHSDAPESFTDWIVFLSYGYIGCHWCLKWNRKVWSREVLKIL